MSGNDIDVYLEPLVDELKQLWDGVETYDANKGTTFKMRAALIWTISDFPRLKNLSGWNTYSGLACPTSKRRCIGEDADQDDSYWKKRSVFFELPYWKDHMLRHNLDVMHIEQNICDNVVFTILNDSVKSKDNLKASKDLQSMGIRPELWPDEGGKYPSAIFTMSNPQKNVFLKTLQNVVFPDGYSSNITRCVDIRKRKLYGLKSHDCHILMEQLLPILVKNALPSPVSTVIANLSSFFRELCGKAVNPMQLGGLSNHVMQILSRVNDQPVDVTNNIGKTMFPEIGKASRAVSHFGLTLMERDQAHRHVLVNCEAVVPFIDTFRTETKRKLWHQTRSPSKIDRVVHAEFSRWFKRKVPMDSTLHSKEMKLLACGPMQARCFRAYNINGYKFRTITKEDGLKTQNSGVYVSSNTSYASMRDNRVAVGSVPYYGNIVDIIELNYSCHFTVVLFKCIWVDTTTSRGIKQYHLDLTSVNFTRPTHTGDREEDEPYILASKAHLVYYVRGEVDQEWSVAVHVKPRDLYDMGGENEKVEAAAFSPQPGLNMSAAGDISDLQLTREDDIEDPIEDVSDNIDDVA
ncbi:uncharacterized protein LOC107633813 [Arachis ipaensis]|uniref:uncharacterized protein LOC107633813 n=1 Tax=Arachis ipaensis TaxID=130454 RepID=UPI0007AF635B|nr:uncharacterized protein LOC107633813 [Arachis ipaensis]XP_025640808.1 uncharacterized protein LOC112735489 [Arachis hypogaea]